MEVHPDSLGIPRVPRYLGACPRERLAFCLRGFHPLRRAFPGTSARQVFCNSPRRWRPPPDTSRYPSGATPASFYAPLVWADPLSLAATQGVAFCFPFLGVLRCFSSPRIPPGALRPQVAGLSGLPGFPIRASPGLRPFAPRRGFSQLCTPFFGCGSRGIHQVPFTPWRSL